MRFRRLALVFAAAPSVLAPLTDGGGPSEERHGGAAHGSGR